MRLELRLVGEVAPIAINIRQFAVRHKKRASSFSIIDASASRRWLDAALREFVVGRRFTIPRSAASALELLT